MLSLGHSFFDKPIFRKWAQKYVPDWNPSWNRKRCASYIKKCSSDIKNLVFELFKCHQSFLEPITINESSSNHTTVIGNISNRFQTLKRIGIPWTNMEYDGWKSNTGADTICISINMINKTLKKVTIPICFKEVNNKSKEELAKLLFMIATENKLSSFLTSCSTDNASVVLGASTPFKGFNIFPLFDILAGCSIHQIQLFVKDLISDIIQILEENDLSNLLTKEDLDTLIDNE